MCVYNSFNTWGWLDSIEKDLLEDVEVILGDVRDPKSVNDSMKGIDVVIHLASLIAIPHSYHSPYSYLNTNTLGTLNIMEACLKNNISKIIHTSTSEVYGDTIKMPISENTLPYAKSPYAATKIGADQIAQSYYSSFNLPVTIIRPFNTYGPRQSNRAIIPTMITQLISNKKKISLGSLYPTRDFSYIFDTIRGFELAINNTKVIGEIINIGSGFEISINDLFQTLCKIMKKSPKIVTDSNRVRPKKGEVFRLKADNRKANKILKWKPIYKGKNGLIKGLKETVEWFSDERNLLKYKTDHYVK
jgi:dTDP-glucose 4,6-dehydratase